MGIKSLAFYRVTKHFLGNYYEACIIKVLYYFDKLWQLTPKSEHNSS